MSEWQPIETAPKDGSWIWGYGDGEQFKCRWHDKRLPAPDDYGHDAGWGDRTGLCNPGNSAIHQDYQWPPLNQPSHWMPLPEPPVTS